MAGAVAQGGGCGPGRGLWSKAGAVAQGEGCGPRRGLWSRAGAVDEGDGVQLVKNNCIFMNKILNTYIQFC